MKLAIGCMKWLIPIILSMNCLTAIGQTSIDVESKYVRSDVAGVLIENSLPKGGLKTNYNGRTYVYAVFWTRIVNETAYPLTFGIDFPTDSLPLPSSPGSHFRLFLPSNPMTPEKEKRFDYGLPVVEIFTNKRVNKPSSLKRTVKPKESTTFYVVTLFDKGINGTLRTGLRLKGQNLLYRVNDMEINCGRIHFRK